MKTACSDGEFPWIRYKNRLFGTLDSLNDLEMKPVRLVEVVKRRWQVC